MTEITREQSVALQAAGWTEEEATTFAQAVTSFREGLPPRQRDAFNAILTTAGAAARGDDVQGHLVVIAVISVLMPMLLPSVQ